MKTFLTLIFLVFSFNSLYAQGSITANSLSFKLHQPLNFTYNSTNDLLKENILENAFQLDVNTHQNDAVVSVYMIITGNGNVSDMYNKFYLRLINKTSVASNAVLNQRIAMSPSPKALFTEPKMGGNTLFSSFNYDFILNPDENGLKPANYNFSLIFTMTRP